MAGERGGSWFNPLDNVAWWAKQPVKAVASTMPNFGVQNGRVTTGAFNTNPQSNAGQVASPTTGGNDAKPQEYGFVQGQTTYYSGGSGRNSSGYYGDYTSDQVNGLNAQLSQTDRLLESLGVTRSSGLQNIENNYQSNVNRARGDQDRFNRDLNIRREDNQTNKTNSLNRINTDIENKYNSVMRMLGIKGAGVSSSAQMVAPRMLAESASAQRADQFDTFGRNMGAVDRAQKDGDEKYTSLLGDLLNQRNSKRNSYEQDLVGQESELRGTRANILAQLDVARGGNGSTAYQDYNDRLARNQAVLDDLKRNAIDPVYQYKAIDTSAPNLEQYTADPLAVAQQGAQDPTASEVNAYLPWMQRKEKLGLL